MQPTLAFFAQSLNRLASFAGNGSKSLRQFLRARRKRVLFLATVIAVPAMAAPGDFGAVAGSAPMESEAVSRKLAAIPAMPFERPGMSFPGSAFFYLADPPEAALVALPDDDPLAAGTGEQGRTLGEFIDAGPAARAFVLSGSASAQSRAVDCLAQAVWYEAASESVAGQRAVAQVVLNRVAHPSWPSSVCGVVYQGSQRSTGCQFTFTCDGSLRRKAGGASWERARAVATDALAGNVYAPIGLATHYHTLWVNPVWASSLDHVGTIGAHRFYRNRGAGGESAAFAARYSGDEPGVGAGSAPAPALAERGSPDAPRLDYAIAPQSPEAAAPASAPKPERRGMSGSVREEYARAGQWKEPPAKVEGMPQNTAKAAASPSKEID